MDIKEAIRISEIHSKCEGYVTCEMCPIDIMTSSDRACWDIVIDAKEAIISDKDRQLKEIKKTIISNHMQWIVRYDGFMCIHCKSMVSRNDDGTSDGHKIDCIIEKYTKESEQKNE